jgi:hypothetical protein
VTVAEQVAAEQELADTLDEYKGQWVAIRDHTVVANADTLGELRGKIESEVSEQDEVEIFRVAADPHAACFF